MQNSTQKVNICALMGLRLKEVMLASLDTRSNIIRQVADKVLSV
jgi:hypothetical protein